jgi:hypothetical protein
MKIDIYNADTGCILRENVSFPEIPNEGDIIRLCNGTIYYMKGNAIWVETKTGQFTEFCMSINVTKQPPLDDTV